MTLWCVIPVQPADEGKSRLAEVLGREARQSLCERLFERTVGLAVDAFGQGRCIVISRSADLLARAHRHGAATLSEQEPYGLNNALEQAADAAAAWGGGGILSLSCDLPFLSLGDLAALADLHDGNTLVIATDNAGSGTNALLMPLPNRIAYAYGPDSCARHAAAAAAAGLHVRILRRDGLACDLDTPADLDRLGRSGSQFAVGAAGGKDQRTHHG